MTTWEEELDKKLLDLADPGGDIFVGDAFRICKKLISQELQKQKEEIRPILEACEDYLGERDVPLPAIPGFEHVKEDLEKLTIRKEV